MHIIKNNVKFVENMSGIWAVFYYVYLNDGIVDILFCVTFRFSLHISPESL